MQRVNDTTLSTILLLSPIACRDFRNCFNCGASD